MGCKKTCVQFWLAEVLCSISVSLITHYRTKINFKIRKYHCSSKWKKQERESCTSTNGVLVRVFAIILHSGQPASAIFTILFFFNCIRYIAIKRKLYAFRLYNSFYFLANFRNHICFVTGTVFSNKIYCVWCKPYSTRCVFHQFCENPTPFVSFSRLYLTFVQFFWVEFTLEITKTL